MNGLDKLYGILDGFGLFFPGKKDMNHILEKSTVHGLGYEDNQVNAGGALVPKGQTPVNPMEQGLQGCSIKMELIKQSNTKAIIQHAVDNLSGNSQADDVDIDMGWLLQFMEMSGKISDKMLQMIWGRILASKVKRSSGISLRSLFTVARLSPNEAQLFTKISKYIVNLRGNNLLLNDSTFNERYGIRYYDILRLDEYGLINSSGMILIDVPLSNAATSFLQYGNHMLQIFCVEKTKLNLQIFSLREAGDDLLTIMDRDIDEAYLDDFKETIAKKQKGIGFFDMNITHE